MPVLEEKAKALPAGNERLNISLPGRVYSDLRAASRETRRSMTELVRLGISLVKIALEAEREGNRIIIASADGKAIKEIILPS